jgi:hypothetical protein
MAWIGFAADRGDSGIDPTPGPPIGGPSLGSPPRLQTLAEARAVERGGDRAQRTRLSSEWPFAE